MDLVVIIAIVSALAAIAAAIAAGIQARASVKAAGEAKTSREASEAARADAVALTRQANDLLERQARAQERVAELAQAQAPKDEFGWTYSPSHGDMVLMSNAGNVTVYDVAAEGGQGVDVDEDSTAAVLPPGDYVTIGVMPSGYGGRRRDVTMTWRYSPDGEKQRATVAIRPNR